MSSFEIHRKREIKHFRDITIRSILSLIYPFIELDLKICLKKNFMLKIKKNGQINKRFTHITQIFFRIQTFKNNLLNDFV